jgi:Family of unknown function (DUF6445)
MTDILQCDDFAPDLADVREAVIRGGFTTQTGPDGAKYTGISTYPVPAWYGRITEFLGKPILPRLSCFRLNLAGELPHSWVHSDEICAQFASVLYLNLPDQCRGGTAFWRHKISNLDRLPVGKDLKFYRQMDAEWKDLSLWEQVALVSMRWNRFITYPTCLFHSRYPHEAFGAGPENGRLIWICFYDLKNGVGA